MALLTRSILELVAALLLLLGVALGNEDGPTLEHLTVSSQRQPEEQRVSHHCTVAALKNSMSRLLNFVLIH